MKVAVYAIALNEAAFLERFMATAREADAVVVADTGSSDNTVAALVASPPSLLGVGANRSTRSSTERHI